VERFATYVALEEQKGGDLTQRDRYTADAHLFKRWGLLTDAELEEGLAWVEGASDAEIARFRRTFSSEGGLYHDAYLYTVRYVKRSLGIE
jgi:hypothetical protein